jgi:hypothetical protein
MRSRYRALAPLALGVVREEKVDGVRVKRRGQDGEPGQVGWARAGRGGVNCSATETSN